MRNKMTSGVKWKAVCLPSFSARQEYWKPAAIKFQFHFILCHLKVVVFLSCYQESTRQLCDTDKVELFLDIHVEWNKVLKELPRIFTMHLSNLQLYLCWGFADMLFITSSLWQASPMPDTHTHTRRHLPVFDANHFARVNLTLLSASFMNILSKLKGNGAS